ncbi:ferritin-like domain-containing protein [Streptomyces sp. MB09-01]|uniref:ferritin-like domain-containing protein n=1 Tax=Streptomyces sp. MB09-01 TaxID=3028666 RepID=UPI0029BD7AC7|nr:ferritin-like domain-containing protein [Streptomyces sp. MB09-01]MDX3535549.1 ferritin-like domain-containing protein [Streptomyces sp. MB09-01]
MPAPRAGEPDRLMVETAVSAVLNWDYDARTTRLSQLYESAKLAQWNASTDIDWSLPVGFGSPLPEGSAYALGTFRSSPLAHRGKAGWDAFRWEVQAWMVSQFLHGEQAALVSCARLAEVLPEVEAKLCAISQAGDEARHVEAFARYVREHVPDPYPVTEALRALFQDALVAREWEFTALAIQCLVEPVALAGFRLAEATFHDALIKQIVVRVARDEARHVSFGVLLLKDVLPELSDAERAHREEFVLEAIELLRLRFLLTDVWERLEVDRAAGVRFATYDPGLAAYRRSLFSRIVPMLAQIGLLTPTVVARLDRLDLLDRAAARTVERMRRGGRAG